jgi:peroxiredoxin
VKSCLNILVLCAWCGACAPRTALVAAESEALDLSLARSDGTLVELAALRGKPTLLFLFATYDATSQLALTELLSFVEHEPRIQVLGVAVQPDAKAFLDLYQRALSVPFALFFDPENQLLRGASALGRLRAVPGLVALDAAGHLRMQHYGATSLAQLRALADSALTH